jgi:hypothetical protein
MNYNLGMPICHCFNALSQSVALSVCADRLHNNSGCLENNGQATTMLGKSSVVPSASPHHRAFSHTSDRRRRLGQRLKPHSGSGGLVQ